ncbi:LysR family transcriptional regulator, regulator for metE and metH [Pseudoalteromonas espejiana DSM 9414]|uniref:LysR family transcriptional regulator n=1 Tax=Pseudoalteromonas espejiana TaxID=28107 RepID=A0A510Y164_9GAMM|nr:LysR family transcriptional regulator [Pseudoalteromonas espejiana]ASM51694.1 LysR family transcriptional regulator, regulator for metE and metH [Pseudoalteromonas espejiana DSM 9414]GEK57040.1 LysR family transcriptional regulator [Pseudoalteromonas espejiana]
MLERNHLHIIKEVNRLKSVTAAAESLNLSQSAVSHTIAKLERRFGVKLWRRKGNTLVYSQAGLYLLSLADKMVAEFEYAERVLQEFAQGRRGIMRIGMECHPCEQWLMGKIQQFLKAWPEVDVEIKSAFRFDGIAALNANEIDVLITPDPVNTEGLNFRSVFNYNLCIVVSEQNPLYNKTFVTAHDLEDQILYTVPVGYNRLDVYTRFLDPANVQPKRRVPIETTEMMLQLVSANRGVAALPEWLVSSHESRLGIKGIRIGNKGLQKSVNVGVRDDDLQLDYVKGFIESTRSNV